jgi:regulator of replication initiation timing
MPDQARRAEDKPAMVERVIALEYNVTHVKDTVDGLASHLREHIDDEGASLKVMGEALQRVSLATELNTATMERMANTLETVAQQNVRLHSVEEWRSRVDPKVEATETKLEATKDRIDFIYKLVAVGVPVIIAAWTLLTHFNIL